MSVTDAAYGRPAMAANEQTWPVAAVMLASELRANPRRLALLAGDVDVVDAAARRIATALDVEVLHLGRALAEHDAPPATSDIEDALDRDAVVVDVDILFTPQLGVDVLTMLRRARRHDRLQVVAWPGAVAGSRATYSRPGRPDHCDVALTDVVVLRACAVHFDDEVPFTIERSAP